MAVAALNRLTKRVFLNQQRSGEIRRVAAVILYIARHEFAALLVANGLAVVVHFETGCRSCCSF